MSCALRVSRGGRWIHSAGHCRQIDTISMVAERISRCEDDIHPWMRRIGTTCNGPRTRCALRGGNGDRRSANPFNLASSGGP
jgi:hypothetical protein